MSANNYILIDRKNLQVSVRDAETGAILLKIANGIQFSKKHDK